MNAPQRICAWWQSFKVVDGKVYVQSLCVVDAGISSPLACIEGGAPADVEMVMEPIVNFLLE